MERSQTKNTVKELSFALCRRYQCAQVKRALGTEGSPSLSVLPERAGGVPGTVRLAFGRSGGSPGTGTGSSALGLVWPILQGQLCPLELLATKARFFGMGTRSPPQRASYGRQELGASPAPSLVLGTTLLKVA